MTKDMNYVKHKRGIKRRNRFIFKLCLCLFCFGLCILMGCKFIVSSLNINSDEKLHYRENGNVQYSVCLKDNDFFEDECLRSDMSYVASLIKNIPLNFNYQFNSNIDGLVEKVDYDIIAKLIIVNNDTKAKYYEKEYVLVPLMEDVVKNRGTLYNLNKEVLIDYEYYNNIASNFKSQYGVDAQSYLEVSLNTSNRVNSKYDGIPSSSLISVTIPLSQKAIEINFNTKETNRNIDKVISSNVVVIREYFKFIIGIILVLLSLVFLSFALIVINKYNKGISKYDKFIKRILREYDRLIVETSSYPDENEYNVLFINNFNELVDVRDNLRTPIMFYNIKKEKMCKFYILNGNNLYLYVADSRDINGGD